MKKCFLGTTCIVMFSVGSNPSSRDSEADVTDCLKIQKCKCSLCTICIVVWTSSQQLANTNN